VDREALVGEEAHIVSRAAAGPRHGSEPDGGYDGIDNLILLCRVCHAAVDRQPATYPVETLRALRDKHVTWVRTRTRSTAPPPRVRFTPIPTDLELALVSSGRQLLGLLGGVEDVAFRHDQPRDATDAALMSEFMRRVGDADLEIEAIGSHHAIDLSHEFHDLLLEQLLPAGIIVLGTRAGRKMSADEVVLPWTTCVLSIQYAPQTAEAHGATGSVRANDARPGLAAKLQALLAEGRTIREKPRISDDGSSAVIEVWERDLRRTLEADGRHDLIQRFEADGPDLARFVSGAWATRRRFDRELRVLADAVTELVDRGPPL